MSSKDEARQSLIGAAADAQGRGDREAVRELLSALADLDKPEKAVQKKRTETRKGNDS